MAVDGTSFPTLLHSDPILLHFYPSSSRSTVTSSRFYTHRGVKCRDVDIGYEYGGRRRRRTGRVGKTSIKFDREAWFIDVPVFGSGKGGCGGGWWVHVDMRRWALNVSVLRQE
ncbi:hypothetical protein ABW19_dt0205959 [Dactylella cylindrospora]|nr:hypothetical protein ABW19_dt0205959 [Dactylella cylindrospora]